MDRERGNNDILFFFYCYLGKHSWKGEGTAPYFLLLHCICNGICSIILVLWMCRVWNQKYTNQEYKLSKWMRKIDFAEEYNKMLFLASRQSVKK